METLRFCSRKRSFSFGSPLVWCFITLWSYAAVCLGQDAPTTPAPTTPALATPAPTTPAPTAPAPAAPANRPVSPVPAPLSTDELGKLDALLDFEIEDKRVDTLLTSPGPKKVVVTLRGDLNTPQEEIDVIATVRRVLPDAKIRNRLFIKSPGPAKAPEQEITDLWVLTYIRSRVTPTGTNSQNSDTPDNIEVLVAALNEIYGLPGKPAVQRAGVGRLLLRGPRTTVLDIKRFLALIDAPWPQVQMNMWAVQVSGSPEDVSRRIQVIGDQIRTVRDQMQEVQRKLAQLVVVDEPNIHDRHWKPLRRNFDLAGVDLPFDGPLSLNESLILLTLHPLRTKKVEDLQRFIHDQWKVWTEEWRMVDLQPEGSLSQGDRHARRQPEQNGQQTAPRRPAFYRLHKLAAETSHEADQQAFFRFRDSLYCFKDKTRWVNRPDASHSLVRTGAVVDRVLKSVMDAFAADMADLFLDPLLQELQGSTSHKKDDGTALVGRTRVVVTSGLEAGLAPEMASFVESSIPKPFGRELLDAAFPASESGTTTTENVLTGAGKTLAGLSDGQALALAALLAAETEPAYTKVAPGIAVNVRPSVLPDGGAARLTIDARFGIESTPQNMERTDIWRQAPPAGIKSHNVRTDASVSAFDLFDISSFSVTASHPRTPLYIPILGRLPVIGKAFQIPRRNKEVHFESLVLVNTVILPRSIELHRFYGCNIDPERDPKQDPKRCREEQIPAAALQLGQ